eukprot:1296868-Heterocapsa_arctica.AAC.1
MCPWSGMLCRNALSLKDLLHEVCRVSFQGNNEQSIHLLMFIDLSQPFQPSNPHCGCDCGHSCPLPHPLIRSRSRSTMQQNTKAMYLHSFKSLYICLA